jgi:hypothetical protein
MKERLILVGILLVGFKQAPVEQADDTFGFFQPGVVVTPADRQAIDRGNTLVRVLPGREREVAVFSAIALKATGEDLMKGVRQIAELKRSSFVLAIRRFSDPPRIQDLEELSLGDADLNSIQRCRSGSCDINLGSSEIERVQRAMAAPSGRSKAAAVQDLFRIFVFERVEAYLARGHEGISGYPINLQQSFSAILRGSPLTERMPEFAGYLENYPGRKTPEVESFLYWSKESFGNKPVVSVTHVGIMPGKGRDGLPAMLVAGKQVFATHYMNASLNLTAVLTGPAGSHNYLALLTRTEVDLLGGYFGWLKRTLIERRLKDETQKIILGLRQRLEH